MSARPRAVVVGTGVVSAILGAVGWEYFRESSKPLASETVAAAAARGNWGDDESCE